MYIYIIKMHSDINTQVVNVSTNNIRPKYKNLHEWISNKDENVYIGKKSVIFINGIKYPLYDSLWANPFTITKEQSREEVLKLYKIYIEEKIEKNNLYFELNKLKGKKLGCWCKPENCHGDILVDLVNKYENKIFEK